MHNIRRLLFMNITSTIRRRLFTILWLLFSNSISRLILRKFNRGSGKLSRVIAGIFRRKFDGAYYSWLVTLIDVQELENICGNVGYSLYCFLFT
ncbi:hypothetical protein EUTSA_v10024099mg [Eutrema salsugineum]|uniref:Uncharacterized protein n=1 Tax=Eutrema salsugineum TaxID=72664 RepID=V4KQY7_EUTSA|nr:hypothetical protein EUTSA_v10024099mg [Eutrema salsugineum]